MKLTKSQLVMLIQEEIRKLRPGCYKVYPKKPKQGQKHRKALSKACKTKTAAKRHLAAIEISKNMSEADIDEQTITDYQRDPYKYGMTAADVAKNFPEDKLYSKQQMREGDPAKGTGKKPKGSGRRLYTDENPRDTVSVKFKTASDIRKTLAKKSFKSKSHKRQSQIINLIHQRTRAAYKNAKDPKTKARLKRAFKYAKQKKEASKRKTQRMRKKK